MAATLTELYAESPRPNKDLTSEAAVNNPPMKRLDLRLGPHSSHWVIINFCSCSNMWVMSIWVCSMTVHFHFWPDQLVWLVVAGTCFLHTSWGSNLTVTCQVCRQQLVIRNPGCSFRTIPELRPCSMIFGRCAAAAKPRINRVSWKLNERGSN